MAGHYHKTGKKKTSLSYSVSEPSVPAGVFFRVRLFLCCILFCAFVLADRTLPVAKGKQALYQAMEEPVSETTIEAWKQRMPEFSLKNFPSVRETVFTFGEKTYKI